MNSLVTSLPCAFVLEMPSAFLGVGALSQRDTNVSSGKLAGHFEGYGQGKDNFTTKGNYVFMS